MINGWHSRYDYDEDVKKPGMPNLEKYTGRKLHVQDNFWLGANIVLFGIAIPYLLYLILHGYIDPRGIIDFLKFLK